MKTPDQALTEWVDDEISFDYCDGRGALIHNRDQFIKVCGEFKVYDPATYRNDSDIGSGQLGPSGIPSGAVRSGALGQMHVSTGFISRGGAGTATLTTEAPRDDISKIANWSVMNRIKQAAFLCTDFFSPVMINVDKAILARVQTMLEPRNVAQFSSAKDLILKLMELSIEHENAGTSTH